MPNRPLCLIAHYVLFLFNHDLFYNHPTLMILNCQNISIIVRCVIAKNVAAKVVIVSVVIVRVVIARVVIVRVVIVSTSCRQDQKRVNPESKPKKV